ncbi:MAG: hypothetical protein LBI53_02890 [Candidatus Peribacteria bacterium]|jgi:hypothetical protein|nr:hypothetical protein [Candidatus Peribacteria bacterium]
MRGIIKEESSIDTIQRALSALEIVKFTTAIHVFPHMDSILTVMASMLGVNKADLKVFLEKLQERGEKDIASYVHMCYLNPYEVDKNCLAIGDLDRYYKDILKDTSIDLSLLKNVLSYLDTFLEQKDIPSFSILFNGFNAATKSIDFSVDINITKQDQLKLMEDKILNPQIFILTKIINLLKQSFFVIGANIDAKTIAVTTKTVTVGNTTYTVLNSRKNFSLPIQKETEREIFNYIDDNALLELEGLSNIPRLMEFTDAEEVSEVIAEETQVEEQERVEVLEEALEAELVESSEEESSEKPFDVAEPGEVGEAFEAGEAFEG